MVNGMTFDEFLDDKVQNIVAISMAGLNEPLWDTRQKVRAEVDEIVRRAHSVLIPEYGDRIKNV
jgi:hypothetical protein